jgi:hypothetical protein
MVCATLTHSLKLTHSLEATMFLGVETSSEQATVSATIMCLERYLYLIHVLEVNAVSADAVMVYIHVHTHTHTHIYILFVCVHVCRYIHECVRT